MALPDHDDSVGRPVSRDVKRSLEYMRGNLDRPITMADLVTASGVSARTLTKHFSAFLGLSPLRYLCRLRLAAAREDLLAGANAASVTQVAMRYGFAHFGRFSARYHKCFGEYPSTTLKRTRSRRDRNRDDVVTEVRTAGVDERRRPRPSREKPTVAILPCLASALEAAHGWFAASVAEAIAVTLCSVRSLTVVVARSPHAAIRDPQRTARELGANYFLTGRIVQAEARLRLIIRVAETATGRHVWGDSYDGAREDLLDLQDRVVRGVVRALLLRIRRAEIDRARRTHPRDLDAHGLALRALPFVFASRPDAARHALELLGRAMEIDPDHCLAVALAAWCHGQLVMYNGTSMPEEERTSALQLARRAALLDDDDPLVLTARCAVHTMAGELDVAGSLVARALALDPTSGWAWGRSAWLNSYSGRSEIAIDRFGRSVSLDPYSRSNSFAGIGSAHFGAGRYAAAAFWMRKALIESPGASWANRTLSVSYARMGEQLQAREALDALRRYSPDLTVRQVVAAIPFRQHYLQRLGEGLSDLGLPS